MDSLRGLCYTVHTVYVLGLTYQLDNFLVGYLNSFLIAFVAVGVGYCVSCAAGMLLYTV